MEQFVSNKNFQSIVYTHSFISNILLLIFESLLIISIVEIKSSWSYPNFIRFCLYINYLFMSSCRQAEDLNNNIKTNIKLRYVLEAQNNSDGNDNQKVWYLPIKIGEFNPYTDQTMNIRRSKIFFLYLSLIL